MNRLLLDVRPLRARTPFRRLWAGNMLSGFGSSLSSFALLYYVWTSTHNAALLGLLGLVQLVPLVVCSFIGGHLADRVDRRRLVLWTRVAQVVTAFAMAAVIISGDRAFVVLFALVALQNGLSSLGAPAARAFVSRVVEPDLIGAAYGLSNVGMQVILIGGPLIAGLVIAAWGVDVCFVLDAATFLAAIYGVFGLPRMPQEPLADGHDRSVIGGLRLVTRTPVLVGAFLADLSATVLSMPVALFPIINSERYGGSPTTLGLFLPALAVGGVIIGVFSGRITRSARPGVLMLVGGGLWAASFAAFAAIDVLWMALPFLAIAGAADAVSVISRGVIVQRVTPNAYRGRVNALDFVVGAGGPQLGNIRGSLVASVTSGTESMLLGGLAALIGTGLIAIFTPSVRRFRLEDHEQQP